MKILHIIPSANRAGGGPIEGLVQIGGIMAELGVEQSVLTLDAPTDPHVHAFPRQIFAGGPPHRTGSGVLARLGEWARFSPDARDWAKRNVRDYDAVVINSLWNYATRVARLALVGSSVPYVVYPHGMLDPWFRRRYPLKHAAKQALWLFNEGQLIRNADAVLFTCEQERLLARQTFWPYRARERVVPYGAGNRRPPIRRKSRPSAHWCRRWEIGPTCCSSAAFTKRRAATCWWMPSPAWPPLRPISIW